MLGEHAWFTVGHQLHHLHREVNLPKEVVNHIAHVEEICSNGFAIPTILAYFTRHKHRHHIPLLIAYRDIIAHRRLHVEMVGLAKLKETQIGSLVVHIPGNILQS